MILALIWLGAPSPRAVAQVQGTCVNGGACNCNGVIRPMACNQTCAQVCGGPGGGMSQAQAAEIDRNTRAVWSGYDTINYFRKVKEQPVPTAFVLPWAVPLCIVFDTLSWTARGLYYGGKGIGYGFYYTGVGIGQAVAYPFHTKAYWTMQALPVACDWDTSGSFDSYKTWEACRSKILYRQKAMTKLDPSNRPNLEWCKLHQPLSNGLDRPNWEQRCNPSQ